MTWGPIPSLGWVESDWPLDMRGNCVAGLGTPTLEDQAVPLALLICYLLTRENGGR